jgi:hypothetical protein
MKASSEGDETVGLAKEGDQLRRQMHQDLFVVDGRSEEDHVMKSHRCSQVSNGTLRWAYEGLRTSHPRHNPGQAWRLESTWKRAVL